MVSRYYRLDQVIGSSTGLRKKTAVILGLGGLGSPSAIYLASSGVNLVLVDRDIVDESNLQRQILYLEENVGELKVVAAKRNLSSLNSRIKIKTLNSQVDVTNISKLKGDVIVDGLDNNYTRFLLNDYCLKNKIPWVYGAYAGWNGLVAPLLPKGPCLRCLLEHTGGESCQDLGVVGSGVGTIGTIQATEAIKILLGASSSKLIFYDAKELSFEEVAIKKRRGCPACAGRYEFLEGEKKMITLCGKDEFQFLGPKISFSSFPKSKVKKYFVKVEDGVFLFRDGRLLIKNRSERSAKRIADRVFSL